MLLPVELCVCVCYCLCPCVLPLAMYTDMQFIAACEQNFCAPTVNKGNFLPAAFSFGLVTKFKFRKI